MMFVIFAYFCISGSNLNEENNDKTTNKDDASVADKKNLGGMMGISGGPIKENKGGSGGRGGSRNQRGGGRQNNYNTNYNYNSYRGSSTWSSNKDSSRFVKEIFKMLILLRCYFND